MTRNAWILRRDDVISRSILTPKGPEYKIETLQGKLQDLNQNGANSNFFQKLQKIRKDFQSFGRFD